MAEGKAIAGRQDKSLRTGRESTERIVAHAVADSWSPCRVWVCRATAVTVACNAESSLIRSSCRIAHAKQRSITQSPTGGLSHDKANDRRRADIAPAHDGTVHPHHRHGTRRV